MAEIPTYFKEFLQNIRLSSNQVAELKAGHETLRNRLREDSDLKPIIVSTFLQGSYRRATIIKPRAEKRSDIDIVVVTTLPQSDYTPGEALDFFKPFCQEHYRGKYKIQGRSIGIEMSRVDLDLVVTSAPSEEQKTILKSGSVRSMASLEEASAWRLNMYWPPVEDREDLASSSRLFKAAREEEWKAEPLLIPDRDAEKWEPTNPLEQIRWTRDKNANTDGHFVNVVKALKWWRRVNFTTPKRPKGYPLEHLIGECCPDGVGSVACGIVRTMESIRDDFAQEAAEGRTPDLRDRGVDQDVMKRVPGEEFSTFHDQVRAAATLARDAYETDDVGESAKKWRELFGSEFPDTPKDESGGGPGGAAAGGFSERKRETNISGGRFA